MEERERYGMRRFILFCWIFGDESYVIKKYLRKLRYL